MAYSNKLFSVRMVLDRCNLARLMSEIVANTIVLVLRRCLKYLRCGTIFFFGIMTFDRLCINMQCLPTRFLYLSCWTTIKTWNSTLSIMEPRWYYTMDALWEEASDTSKTFVERVDASLQLYLETPFFDSFESAQLQLLEDMPWSKISHQQHFPEQNPHLHQDSSEESRSEDR